MKKLLFILIALIPFSAMAAEPENMKLKYEAFYSRMKVGELRVELAEDSDGNYKYSADVDTFGICKYITKYWSRNLAEGKIIGKNYVPSSFKTSFQPKKRPKQDIIVTYDKAGHVSEIANPPEIRERRPLVEGKDKDNVLDPVTAVLVTRQRIREIVEAGTPLPYKYTQQVFDGRRVFTADGSIEGYVDKNINGKKEKLLHLHGQRVPYAGFHPKELEKIKGTEPVFDIYLDSNYIPVLVEGKSYLGEGTIILAK